ncbi:DUF4179 domain-containing protein [Paenibacillus hamazuiensis]|uniref:DUF4179 domain-containing protein n=1 Tax=Paenibacillus hamazuiensis TaxID=2936508 RepID=UPI00200E28AA|nr:DUF4179 domain-containing protein [Paenibacillus hamazuiensis]
MRCLSADEMEDYILETPSPQKQQKALHIDFCPRCLTLYRKRLEEQEILSRQLFEETLPDSFTAKVMAMLALEDREAGKEAGATPETSQVQVGGSAAILTEQEPNCDESDSLGENRRAAEGTAGPLSKGASFWKLALGAVSLLLIAGAAILYAVPTLADTIRSLFTRENADVGLLRMQEFGLVEHPNIMVKDKGYTVKIDEAAADPTRVIVALQLFGPGGKHDRDRLVLTDGNGIFIKDDRGEVVGRMYDMGRTNDFYYLVAFFPEPLQADRITIEGHLVRLGDKMRNIPSIQGDWSFSFAVDMKEAKKQTVVTSLAGSYTTPDGMTVRLKRLTRMVQGVRLEMDTELSEEALARSPGELWKQQGLSFHFEDMQGEEIHSVNTRKSPSKDSLMTQSGIPGDKTGLMHWSYTFKYLPQDSPYKFIFDGYFVSERDDASVQFEPLHLKERPVPFRFDGDELMLRDFTVKSPPDTNSKETEGALHFDGRLRNEDRFSEWILKTPDGRTYTVSKRGASTTEASSWKEGHILMGGPMQGGLYQFRAAGLTQIPDRLQLIRTVVDRRYTNVDWVIPIKEESKGPGKSDK